MIITRYLCRQILQLTAGIGFVLLIVAVLVRFLNYLSEASQGELDPGVLVLLMSYRLPEFIQLILPLALLLGILLAYGRMYAENEMTILVGTGMSQKRLLGITFMAAGVVALLVAVLALVVTPMGLVNSNRLLEAQEDLNEFDVMVPGIFQNLAGGERTTYSEEISGSEMRDVFMFEDSSGSVTVAESATLIEGDGDGRQVRFVDGSISSGVVGGDQAATLTRFGEMIAVVPPREINIESAEDERAMATRALLGSNDNLHLAEWQWRVSLIILIPVLALLAVPLSRAKPRQGRFAKLAPAVMLYIAYFGLLLAGRNFLANGAVSPAIGLWWIHLLFLAFGLVLFFDKLPDVAILKWFR